MDRDTAQRVLRIIGSADSGCENCVADLLVRFSKEFPGVASSEDLAQWASEATDVFGGPPKKEDLLRELRG